MQQLETCLSCDLCQNVGKVQTGFFALTSREVTGSYFIGSQCVRGIGGGRHKHEASDKVGAICYRRRGFGGSHAGFCGKFKPHTRRQRNVRLRLVAWQFIRIETD